MESRLIFRCINQWHTPLLAGIAFLILGVGLIATGAVNTPGPLTFASSSDCIQHGASDCRR